MAKIYIIATDYDGNLDPTFVKIPPWLRSIALHKADFDEVRSKSGDELVAIIQDLAECLDRIVEKKTLPTYEKPPAEPKLPLDDPFAPDSDPDAWRRNVR
jgi:hypothetical protein